ncbi:MAG: tripartite tricarboxylate transporter substrate binding protein [Hyphomicrobiales bacterium]|jgi:tripartite-type tricarboxylate transporter receptor subunit TctC|nr:tripartite tricarboxylate transporter substrate binding protein [Hyphomicrobiales bacterium]
MSKSLACIFTALALVASVPAVAQDYPSRFIRIVVPWPAGAADVPLRLIQDGVSKKLGQPLVIENKPGANGLVGTEYAARVKPDGYTLLYNVTGSVVLGSMTVADSRVDPSRDFVAVADIYGSPMLLIVRQDMPVQNVADLIREARARPGKITIGSLGAGSITHLLIETINQYGKVKLAAVSYKGFAPMVQAMGGGEVDGAFITNSLSKGLIDAGKYRAIATEKRMAMPNVRDVPEISADIPQFESPMSFAYLLAPTGTSDDIVKRLHEAFSSVLQTPEAKLAIEANGALALGNSLPEVKAAFARNIELTKRLVTEAKAAGVSFSE